MKIAKIKPLDIANGDGIGVSVFVSGCNFHCEGCFNSEAWDYDYGEKADLDKILSAMSHEHVNHLSILGGEPLAPRNIRGVEKIIRAVRQAYPDKKIWLWTGYDEDELSADQLRVISMVDYVTYGRFIIRLRNIVRKYSGSDNQYTVEVKTGKVTEGSFSV